MAAVVFYRGIVVEPAALDAAKQQILMSGFTADESMLVPDLRPHLDALLADPSLYTRERDLGLAKGGAVFVSGDEGGATYYACDPGRNKSKAGLIIKLHAPLERCFVDCRDFLCAAFQLWSLNGKIAKEDVRARLIQLFGHGVARYFDRAAESGEQKDRIAMCNAAAHDPAVVAAHYENRTCIGGRFGTIFCSAFVLRTPVPREDIVDVYPGVASRIGTPEVTVDDVR
jgi:hypothetical protein